MSTHNSTYNLFSPSGCLSQEGISSVIFSSLGKDEQELVNDHLLHCQLCKDAVEGLSQIENTNEFEAVIEEIKRGLHHNSNQTSRISGNTIFYYSAAATIVILIGLLFFMNNPFSREIFSRDVAHEIHIPDNSIPSMPLTDHSEQIGSEGLSENDVIRKPETGPTGKSPSIISEAKNRQGNDQNNKMVQERVSDRLQTSNNGLEAFLNEEHQKSITETTKISAVYVDIASNQAIEYYLGEIIVDNANPASLLDLNRFEDSRQNQIPIQPRNEFNKNPGKDANSSLSSHFFNPLETMPEFPGGFEGLNTFLSNNLSYPKFAHDHKIQGRVIVSFLIEKDGSIKNVHVLQGIDRACDEEAIRVIRSMPKWKPALQNGRAASVKFTLPIHFRIL